MQLIKNTMALLLLIAPFAGRSQPKHGFSISGTVKDKKTGETLSGATINFFGHPELGVGTNAYGFYSISIPAGSYWMGISYAGYTVDTVRLELGKDVTVNV